MGGELDLKLVRNQFVQNQFLSTHDVTAGCFNREPRGTVRLVYICVQLSENQHQAQHQVWGG